MYVDPLIQQSFSRSIAALCYLGTITYGLFLVRKAGSIVASFWTWRHDVHTRQVLLQTNRHELIAKSNREREKNEEATQILKQRIEKLRVDLAVEAKRAEAATMVETIKAALPATLGTVRYAYRLKVVSTSSVAYRQDNDNLLVAGDIIEGAVRTGQIYIYPRKGGGSNQINSSNVVEI
jgi:hypothetical protein